MIEKIIHSLRLGSELETFDRIHETITRDVIFRGTNIWILVFAILVACVGLNMNSTAVVIGAMLISPLMGPINGMGYSIATYNFPLLRTALKNFSFAVGAGLFASTVYFAVSPVSTAHSELLARTSPTIYDVLIAFFGGLAGIVAISSRNKGNVIPGVAIATALMPPLCTAGYGLATAQWKFFFGAFYLFTINSVFIALASVVISQVLKFPIRTVQDEARKRRVNRLTIAVTLVTLTPSVYFGYILVKEERFTGNAQRFIESVRLFENSYLLRSQIEARHGRITLVYGGNALDSTKRTSLRQRARYFDLQDADIRIEQGFAFEPDIAQAGKQERLAAEINRLNLQLQDEQRRADSVERRLRTGRALLAEISPLEPRITSCAFAETRTFTAGRDDPGKRALVVLGVSSMPGKKERRRVENWLRARLGTDSIATFWEAVSPK